MMTLNGQPAISARITLPDVGAWYAELAVDAREVPQGPVVLESAGLRWTGFAYRAGLQRDTLIVRVVGGAGGLAREVAPKFYQDVEMRLPFLEVLSAVGERLAASSSASILAIHLDGWTRARGPAGDAIRLLAEHVGATWRILSDGSVWLGIETWPRFALAYEDLERDPQTGRIEIASSSPALIPGVTLDGDRIAKVEHLVDGDRVRTTAWIDTPDRYADDAATALEGLVRHLTAHVDYFGQYAARVVSQNVDGTLELEPDDARLPGFSNVPIRYGVPGVEASLAPGARVFVAFEAGNPAKPVATVWESSSLVSLRVAGSVIPVARIGDTAGPYPILAAGTPSKLKA